MHDVLLIENMLRVPSKQREIVALEQNTFLVIRNWRDKSYYRRIGECFSRSAIGFHVTYPFQLFSELGHVLSICKDCTKRIKEVHSFWRTSIYNNKVLMKYLRQLRVFGSDFGHVKVRINDIESSTDPISLRYKKKRRMNRMYYTGNVSFILLWTMNLMSNIFFRR